MPISDAYFFQIYLFDKKYGNNFYKTPVTYSSSCYIKNFLLYRKFDFQYKKSYVLLNLIKKNEVSNNTVLSGRNIIPLCSTEFSIRFNKNKKQT